MGRSRRVVPSPAQPFPQAEPVAQQDSAPKVIVVPMFPCFSPAAVAALLQEHRSAVQYWLDNGKLDSYTDNIGARYILRSELIRFVREYLKREMQ